MKVVSLNVGRPQEVAWRGRTVLTSIFKEPVARRLRVTKLNIEGDEQSDLKVHGGVDKAVYGYPSEHYEFWRRELNQAELSPGTFGENLTTEGLIETDLRIGDCFRIGTAEFTVTEPRLPCYKLGIRLGRPDILKQFLHSGRSGFYFSVTRAGEVGQDDLIERIGRGNVDVTVCDIVDLYTVETKNQELMRLAIQSSVLPDSWKDYFREQLKQPDR